MLRIAIYDEKESDVHKIEQCLVENLRRHGMDDCQIDTFLSSNELCDLGAGLLGYQIIFLDIKIGKNNGIDAAKVIRKYNKEVYIVFVSAFLDYALEGYKVEAVRYILKDMLEEMLPECVDTIVGKLHRRTKKICYTFLEGKKEIFLRKIYYIESEKHRLYFKILGNEIITLCMYNKLDEIEKDLEKSGFLRIHKSYLVNVDYILDISNYIVKMTFGEEIPIPREKYQQVKEWYFEKKDKWC